MNSFVRHHQARIRFGYHCFDRILAYARIPLFLYPGAIVRFLKKRHQIPAVTPRFLRQLSADYHNWLEQRAAEQGISIIPPPEDPQARREDWVQPYFEQLGEGAGTAGVFECPEKARVAGRFSMRHHWVEQAWRHVNLYYFYLRDPQCGRLFVRLCPYFPFNVQLCLNGHEWLAQQLQQQGIAFVKDDNALLNCAQPQRLQELA